jgi:hypothetical protein
MNIGQAFGYVFEDEQWLTKTLLGGLISIIPLVGTFVVNGYSYKVAQNTARDLPRPLPEWNEFVDALMKGLIGLVVSLIYTLPLGLMYACFVSLLAAAGAGAERGGGEGIVIALSLLFVPLLLIVAVLVITLSFVGMAHYLATDDIGAAFRFGQVWNSFRSHLGSWLMLMLLALLAGIVAALGLIALIVGVIFTSFYAYCVIGHGLGQVMRVAGLTPSAAEPSYSTPGVPPAYPQ